jgi:ferric-dicitrate binding protein FerR (iron transport regulator)
VPPSRSRRRQLLEAGEKQRLVQIRRRKGWVRYDGYVVGLSDDWLALRAVDAVHHHGLVLLRTADVRKVRNPTTRPRVARGVLEQHGQWPPSAPQLLDLWDVRSALFTAGSLAPILSVACEHDGTAATGNVYRITQRRLQLADGSAVELDAITQVQLGQPPAT